MNFIEHVDVFQETALKCCNSIGFVNIFKFPDIPGKSLISVSRSVSSLFIPA
jgi:hypothetical protein